MSHFNIKLSRDYIDSDEGPLEVWYAEVEGADAYDTGQGETPGVALRQLADEFDVEFGAKPRGNWDDYYSSKD